MREGEGREIRGKGAAEIEWESPKESRRGIGNEHYFSYLLTHKNDEVSQSIRVQ